MKPKFLIAVCLGFLVLAQTGEGRPDRTAARKFEFTYDVVIKNIPSGAGRVKVWIPLASSDANQDVAIKKISSPVSTRKTRESEYGDQMLYAEIPSPGSKSVEFVIEYEVTRKEYSKGNYQALLHYNRASDDPPAKVARFLEADRLVPIDGKMKEMADEITQGKAGPIDKAYALYDYVFHTLRYDKSGTGWGRGDALWACDSKHGNCTDFHSLFIAMTRAEKIPARFEIGFPLPATSHAGEIPGYHCWAEFYVQGAGWIPVDISEAWKDPARHDFFFGSLDVNRVRFTIGHDVTLFPKQAGPSLNYFVYPYVEVDGKPLSDLGMKYSFHDMGAGGARAPGFADQSATSPARRPN